ncbi:MULTISPECIES: flagellar hook-length control protein FliK [Campylobacter]|uniref:flagellar hook-length control protein FliK n=1 Tax=Campylobacter TaxID=194 RepID=UPI000A34C111|nr:MULTISPECIES: flagellar hook-length control protein FliK [unclassified Campylobacter]MCR8695649.1 flagellar hook-length control protein FliK [Campylobacter sp. RM19073]MEE3704349.1 flagellar hook-length control protein FliK [Campylobacter sp. CX2-8023-23]
MIIVNNTPTQQPSQNKDEKKTTSKENSSTTALNDGKTILKKPNIAIEQTKLDLELNKFSSKLLNALKSNLDDGSYKQNALSQIKSSQVAPNLAKDLTAILKSIKSDPSLNELGAKLENFIKPVEHIKATNIAQTIKDTGVLLEAKLAQTLSPEVLPANIKSLLSQMKNTANKDLSIAFMALANTQSDPEQSLNALLDILQQNRLKNSQILKNSNFKPLLDANTKLEYTAKFLDKIANQIQTNPKNPISIEQNISRAINQIQNIIKNMEANLSQINFNNANLKSIKPLNNQLNQIITDIKDTLSNIKSQLTTPIKATPSNNQAIDIIKNLDPAISAKLSQNLQNSKSQINLLNQEPNSISIQQTSQSIPDIQSLTNAINPNQNSINLNNFIQYINTDANNLNLQDKLSMAARKLSNIINFFDKNSLEAKKNLTELKSLIKATNLAKSEISNITPNDNNISAQSLQNDLKATLLALKDATANQPNQAALNQNINRLLTQIEMHQLISYAQNSIQTYLPYSWDALESSNIAFKQGKKKRFYAKIDLNFTHFGNVDIVIALSDNKYIDISIATGTAEFKDLILSSSKELKTAITSLGLIVSSFTLAHKPKKTPYSQIDRAFDFGFNKKA